MTISVRSAIGTTVVDARKQLAERGFVRFRNSELLMTSNLKDAFGEIRRVSRYLPPDKTCQGGFRYRRYGKLIALPWLDTFQPVPSQWNDAACSHVLEYTQPAAFNGEECGKQRYFAAIERLCYDNPFIRELVRFDLAQAPFTDDELAGPIQVGIHLIRLVARPDRPAVASPNVVHRDGEHYTCCHLIERDDAEGGENWITDPEWAGSRIEDVPTSGIKQGFTLREPMDSYIVKDDLVAHSVEAVRVTEGAREGVRTVLLIDFTPMKPVLMPEPLVRQTAG